MQPATNSTQAFQNLQNYQQSLKSPGDILQAREASLGVPAANQQVTGLRQAITNTTNLLNQIPGSVHGRTGQSLVTDAQATRQINNEQAPVAQNLQTQGQQFSESQGAYDRLIAQAQSEAQMEQQGQQQQLGSLQSLYDSLYKKEQDALQYQLQQQQLADARAAASRSAFPNLGTTPKKGAAAGAAYNVPPALQSLYNAVFVKPDGTKWTDQDLVSDYNQTLVGARYGNSRDKQKLELYHNIRPDLFGDKVPGVVLGNSPTF